MFILVNIIPLDLTSQTMLGDVMNARLIMIREMGKLVQSEERRDRNCVLARSFCG